MASKSAAVGPFYSVARISATAWSAAMSMALWGIHRIALRRSFARSSANSVHNSHSKMEGCDTEFGFIFSLSLIFGGYLAIAKSHENDLASRLRSMKRPLADNDYYADTDRFSRWKYCVECFFTHWAGWADKRHIQELRAASLVNQQVMIKAWTLFEHPYSVVNDKADLFIFYLLGGHALIESTVAKKYLADVIKPMHCVYSGPYSFLEITNIPDSAKQYAPMPKLRMQVIKRDNGRCLICGRRPADYVDVELHVHHIRPWSRGGLTVEKNLITLCHTCHKGLSPHEDHGLYELVPECGYHPNIEKDKKELLEGIQRYRRKIQEFIPNE